jgi:Phytanoyl-CoA dioxygenase (PhyH)
MRLFFQSFHLKLFAYFQDTIQEFKKSWQWFLMRKIARFHVIRNFFNCLNRQDLSPKVLTHSTESSVFIPEVDISTIRKYIDNDGIFQGLRLKQSSIDEIVDYALKMPCYGSKKPEWGFYFHQHEQAEAKINQKILVGKFFNASLKCEAMRNIAYDPMLQEIASIYFQKPALMVGAWLWWSFPSQASFFQQSKSAQVFHVDLDDFNFFKVFFYLTDVTPENGPHVFIRGSHKKKKFIYQLLRGRATESDLIKYYGCENIITICGSAGWGFIEDVFGYHKGTLPISQARLILELVFATHDYGILYDYVDESRLEMLNL